MTYLDIMFILLWSQYYFAYSFFFWATCNRQMDTRNGLSGALRATSNMLGHRVTHNNLWSAEKTLSPWRLGIIFINKFGFFIWMYTSYKWFPLYILRIENQYEGTKIAEMNSVWFIISIREKYACSMAFVRSWDGFSAVCFHLSKKKNIQNSWYNER